MIEGGEGEETAGGVPVDTLAGAPIEMHETPRNRSDDIRS